jgi:glutaredoxin
VDLAAKGNEVEYRDVKKDSGWLEEMLAFSKGERTVPVVVKGGTVTSIGWGDPPLG